jgi:rubrerythrin
MKKRIIDNWRVVVWPDFMLWTSNEKDKAERIAKEIKRHVDDIKAVELHYDDKYVCSFCNSEWEEDETGCPLCCNAAVEEWDRETNQKSPGSRATSKE